MTGRYRQVVIFVIAALFLTFAGCAPADDPLDGTKWRLTGWSISSLDPSGFTITATFTDGQISGTSAVNTYGGPYKAGPGDAFSVGQLSSTMMGADEPAMRAEGGYTALLGQARSYKVDDDRLTLFDENGNESLIFSPEELSNVK